MDSASPSFRAVMVALSILLLFGATLAVHLLISFTERSRKASALAAYAAARGMTPLSSGQTLMRTWNQPGLNTHASVGGTSNGLRVEVLLSGMRRGSRKMTVVAQRLRVASLPTIGVYRSALHAGAFAFAASAAPPTFSGRFTPSGPPALVSQLFDDEIQRRVLAFPRDIDSVWLDNETAGMQWVETDPVDPAIVDSALETICRLCARADAT